LNASPLDRFRAVHRSYRRTREALKIAHRFLRTDRSVRRGTAFAAFDPDDFEVEFLGMERRLDDATVISLWVVFERFLIEHVMASWPKRTDEPTSFDVRFRTKAGREVERWRLEELLDLYKGWVDANALGTAKQVKSYRDWIAHRNPRKAPSAVIAPDAAYRTLATIVRTVERGEPGGSGPGS
jgi:hypothetical protein